MEHTHRHAELARLLLESVRDEALFVLDAQGRVGSWGAGAERILGYAAPEALERPLDLFRSPEDTRHGDAERTLRVAREESRYEAEEEWVRRDGSRLRVRVAIVALRAGDGEPAGYGVVARDLTDRLVGERALQQRASLVKLLQVVAVAANEATDLEGAVQATLDAVCAHTGWPLGHAYLVGSGGSLEPSGIWHARQRERFRRFREVTEATRFAPGEGIPGEVLAAGEPVWVEDVTRDPHFVRARGGDVGVRATLALPVAAGRTVIGVLEFFSDHPVPPDRPLLDVLGNVGEQLGRAIERTRAEEALRLSEAKFAGIISIAADAIVSVDEEQRIIFYNQGAEQIFGYTAEEIVGEPLDLLVPERFRPGHREHVREFGESAISARRMGERGQISGRRKSGEVFPADASISKIDVDGKRIYTAVLRDVTDRQAAEEALRRQAEELQRSNQELEQFAYVASHDLQEPLRKIQAFGDRLASRYTGVLDAQGADYLQRMHNAAERMQALINDLLAFSRVTTQARPFVRVELERVAREVISDLELRIEQTGARVEVGELPAVQADPVQMRQLFQNLLSNALKFRREGVAPRVRVAARTFTPPGQEDGPGAEWAEITVADNGIGFEEKYLDRVFALFQRLHGRSQYEGTGMGLAICRKIAERHGGTITARSTPGEGSTFIVTIPVA